MRRVLKRASRPRTLRDALLVAVAAAAAALALLAYGSSAFAGLERLTINTRFHVRGPTGPAHGIVIVALDQRSLQALDVRPPVPRGIWAQVIDRVRAGKPRLLALDVQFVGRTDPSEDRALLEAISRARPLVQAVPDTGAGAAALPAGARARTGAFPASVGVDPDPDNILRRMLYRQVALKTLPVRAAEVLRGRRVSAEEFPGNHAWIDFHGPPGTFPAYAVSDVLNGRVPGSAFAGRTVLVGVTAPVVKDVFVTAASTNPMSGVEVHANALATTLDGVPLRSAGDGTNVILLLAMAALPPLLTRRLPALYMLAASVGVLLLLLVGVQLAFDSGRIVSVLYPALALVLAVLGSVAVDALVERRRRQALEKAMGPYLKPRDPPAFFISYRRDESGVVANVLKDKLAARFGDSTVFMDTSSIRPGQEFPKRIDDAIKGCSAMFVLIGPFWLARGDDGDRRIDDPRDWVRLEIERGLQRDDAALVPVLLQGALMPAGSALPETIRALAERNAVVIRAERYAAEFDELVSTIEDGLIQDFVSRARPALDLVVGREDGERRHPVDAELTIGSAADADVSVHGEGVSPRHAKVWPVLGGVMIEDLGSAAGTSVDGRRVDDPVRIDGAASIGIGSATVAVAPRGLAAQAHLREAGRSGPG
ncbi:MAG TPA: CHASE2 domain-containing protein [Thermoleophilaceae bacterium]|nr:CHASE2 domain-containing protein [Thermoleophilaceae bacterium]